MSHWPQFTYIALILLGLGVCIAKHGQPRGPHNLVTDLISTALVLWLLIAGGFFQGVF
jgi:hypothetical protein